MQNRSTVILIGFAITFAIMFFGLLFGILIYNYQTYNVNSEITDLKIRSQEIQFFATYLQTNLDENNCDKFDSGLQDFSVYLNDYGRRLSTYYENQRDLDIVKEIQKDAILGYLNLLLSLNEYNTICVNNKKNYILYMYPYDCTTCDGIVREIRKQTSEKKGIFDISIPADVGLESVDFIREYYNITTVPGIVVNGNTILGSESYNEIEKNLYSVDENLTNDVIIEDT